MRQGASVSSYRPIGRMSWLIIGVGGRACHLELSLDTLLKKKKKKSAGVRVRPRMWVLVILPAAITSTVGLPNTESSLSLSLSLAPRPEQEGLLMQPPPGHWTTTQGALNKCDYTC